MIPIPPLNFAGGTSTSGAPVATGPVSVNVAGFGGRASGSASMNAQQSEEFPASGGGAAGDMPGWLLPLAGFALVLVLVLRRR